MSIEIRALRVFFFLMQKYRKRQKIVWLFSKNIQKSNIFLIIIKVWNTIIYFLKAKREKSYQFGKKLLNIYDITDVVAFSDDTFAVRSHYLERELSALDGSENCFCMDGVALLCWAHV